MKTRFRRGMSAFLALVMVLVLVPVETITVSAVADYTVPTTGHKLLSSYNALSGTDISSGDAAIVSSIDVFNRDRLGELIQNYASYTNMHTQYGEVHEGKDMNSFAASVGISLSRSVGTSVGIEKLFKASTAKKFNFATDVSYSRETEAYFYEYVVKVQKGYYSFSDAYLEVVRENPTAYLSDAFLDALTGADGTTVEEFFDTYGTHIITAYTAGGEAGVSLNSVQINTAIGVDIEADYSSGTDNSATTEGITLGINNALELKGTLLVDTSSKNYRSDAHTYAYGGNDAVMPNADSSGTSFDYESWLNSLNSENAAILVDERLKLIPIWNLIPVIGNESRILELTSYYIKQSEQADGDFYTKYAIDESLFDYSQDWVNFENCKIITNEEELNAIRNDLNGVYVLANNIILSQYADWEPIGTKEEPFRGRLYGNYNTISGLNISATASDDPLVDKTLVGLFGCNDGLITDLKISGDITMPAVSADNVYIGAIAAYNEGIVNNCYDNVQYNISYDDYAKLNLPVRNVDTSETTVVVGDEVGVCLSGTYANLSIQIADNGVKTPAYIVLDGATITGNIYSDNDRPIYIISKGESNSLFAPNDTIAVNAPNATVSIFGDTELTITGGNAISGNAPSAVSVLSLAVNGSLTLNVVGGNGYNGYNGWGNGNGTAGSPGGSGSNGGIAVQAKELIVKNATINAIGGNGGNGGYGGPGNNEAIGNKYQPGGAGGNGGHGAASFEIVAYLLDGATVNSVTGNGGHGGNGGNGGGDTSKYAGWGGNGGRGGDSGDVFALDASGTSAFTYEVGVAGNGGSGGYSANSGKHGGSYGSGTTGMVINASYNGHYYKLIETATSWESAKAACEALGGHLVTITNEEENTVVNTLLASDPAFIGASDIETEGTWAWVTGEAFAYTNWAAGEPNNSGGDQDYGVIYGTSNSANVGKWDDDDATSYYYICEWDSYEDYLVQLGDAALVEEAPDILAGIICGTIDNGTAETIDDGKVRTLNNEQWNDNVLQVTSVTQTEYFSGDVFDSSTTKVQYLGRVVEYGVKKFSSVCKENVLSRMGVVEVTWDNYVRYIPIHITKTIPDHIEVAGVGRTEFAAGEIFDISGLSIKVVYNNGDEKFITEEDIEPYTAPSTEYAGQTEEVVVTYEEAGLYFSASYEITTVEDTIESIFIQQKADWLTYQQGEELCLDGLQVYGSYKSGKKELIDNKNLRFDVLPSLCNVGVCTVAITSRQNRSATTSYTVTVEANNAFEHPWDEGTVTTAPTHTTTGVRTHHCTAANCTGTKTETIPVIEGHSYGDWYKLSDTQHQRICECGDTITLEHDWDVGVTTTPATHLTTGEKLLACEVCDATQTETIEKVSEHTFGTWTKHNDAQHVRACACGEKEYADHTWDGGVTLPDSQTEFTCTACSAKKYEAPTDPSLVKVHLSLEAPAAAYLEKEFVLNVYIAGTYDGYSFTVPEYAGFAVVSVVTADSGIKADEITGGYKISVMPGLEKENAEKELIVTITYTVDENAALGKKTLSLADVAVSNVSGDKENSVYVMTAEVDVRQGVPGDTNGDGIFDYFDVTKLFAYYRGKTTLDAAVEVDINGDGTFDYFDVTKLFAIYRGKASF